MLKRMVLVGLAVVLCSPAWANDVSYITKIYGVGIKTPGPSWVNAVTDFAVPGSDNFYEKQDGNVFIVEMIQKGESFQSWSNLWGVQGVKNANFLKHNAKVWAGAYIDPIYKSCQPSGMHFKPVIEKPKRFSVIYFCTQFKARTAMPHLYNDDIGEIGLLDVHLVKDVRLVHFEKWRGAKFDLQNKDLPRPGSQAQLQKALMSLNGIETY